jgi:flagellar motility protein MotE (MotC chaperone)
MIVAMVFTGIKVTDVVRGTKSLSQEMLITSVQAETTPAPAKELPAEKEAAKEAAAKKEGEAAHDAKPAEGEHGAEAGHGEKEEEKNPNVSETPGETIDDHLSSTQIELLQKLADRRDELDRWEKDIELKENVLRATEKRLNDKIVQIQAMESEVSTMLALYNEKEDTKIRSLVKIYENMKPKDAARIFDEVEMPVLLLVIDKMTEKKVAPILAEMDPKKAKQVTVQFADQRKVDSEKLSRVKSTQPVPPPALPGAATAVPPAASP